MSIPDEIVQKLNDGTDLGALLGDFGNERRWLTLTPFKIHPETGIPTLNAPDQPWRYRIRCFGLPKDYDYDNYDVHEENLNNHENVVLESLEDVERVVKKWVDDISVLSEQIQGGCPI